MKRVQVTEDVSDIEAPNTSTNRNGKASWPPKNLNLSGENNVIDIKNKNGRTILHIACTKGYLDIVQLYIENNFDECPIYT